MSYHGQYESVTCCILGVGLSCDRAGSPGQSVRYSQGLRLGDLDAMPEAERARQNLDSFKAQLFAAHRAQLLSLARADLVAAMPAAAVAASEIEPARGVTFHFVVIDRSQPTFA